MIRKTDAQLAATASRDSRPRRSRVKALIVALATVVAASSIAPASAGQTEAVARANQLLAQLTREEKISLAAGGAAGVPRLGIPPQAFTACPTALCGGVPPSTWCRASCIPRRT